MRDEPREVTTFCPRCGQPIVWSVTPIPDYACHCPLDDDEWDDLGTAEPPSVIR